MYTETYLSHHSAVILYKDGIEKEVASFTRIVTNYNRADWTSINRELSSHQWPDLDEETNLDEAAKTWTNDFNTIVDRHTPHKKITIRPGDNKWMNYTMRISKWAKTKKITLNPSKTISLTVTRTNRDLYPLFMDGEYITEAVEHKHLGMLLQRNSKWGLNTDHIAGRASRRLFILYTQKFARVTLKQLYTSYMRPLLEYGGQVWSNLTAAEEDQLEEIQRAGIRIIAGLKISTSHIKLYEEVDLPTLAQRRYVTRMLTMFDVLNSDMPGRLNLRSVSAVNDRNPYNTRQGLNLTLPLLRTEHFHRSFLPTAIHEWNALTDDQKSCTCRQSLKRMLKHKKRQNPYYDIEVTRLSSVNRARIRAGNHNLKGCLFDCSMTDSAACECGPLLPTV